MCRSPPSCSHKSRRIVAGTVLYSYGRRWVFCGDCARSTIRFCTVCGRLTSRNSPNRSASTTGARLHVFSAVYGMASVPAAPDFVVAIRSAWSLPGSVLSYVFLIDAQARIRWRAVGKATALEVPAPTLVLSICLVARTSHPPHSKVLDSAEFVFSGWLHDKACGTADVRTRQ